MSHQIDDQLIEHMGILAKLELSEEEKEKAKRDMERMLQDIDRLNEVDTRGVEPLSHVFPVCNAFREDTVFQAEDREMILANAPEGRNHAFAVPAAITSEEER